MADPILRVPLDAWYMKGPFILPLLRQQIHVIGQVRKDTVLDDFPETRSPTRGRPRNYGQKWTLQDCKERPPLRVAYLRISRKTGH